MLRFSMMPLTIERDDDEDCNALPRIALHPLDQQEGKKEENCRKSVEVRKYCSKCASNYICRCKTPENDVGQPIISSRTHVRQVRYFFDTHSRNHLQNGSLAAFI